VPEGKVTVQTIGGWGVLPSRSYIYGEMFFSKGKLYGFFTQARLPNGDIVPICMQLSPALDILPGSTAKVARVDYYMLDIEPIQRASK
jgi:serine/threonine-protein kinase